MSWMWKIFIYAEQKRKIHKLTGIKTMTLEELKIRQLTNQYLIQKSDKLTVVRDLCGIQSQFMVNAMHSLKIRCSDFDESTIGERSRIWQ